MPRPMQWVDSEARFGALAANAQSNLLLYNSLSLTAGLVKGATITRMIVDVTGRAGSVAQINYLFWGITVVNADARSAGAFPDSDDMGETAGWLARGRLVVMADSISDASQFVHARLDLRSQRILRSEKDELHLIVDNGSSSFVVDWAAMIRVLVKLP